MGVLNLMIEAEEKNGHKTYGSINSLVTLPLQVKLDLNRSVYFLTLLSLSFDNERSARYAPISTLSLNGNPLAYLDEKKY
ncbi:hypothetical protein OnM2_082029 [Erysiphe neolycopersici]|uniref:Uncharacterized protein n=1 Tax=Erysiphe neolycopersici TaxID=212602 RepID=A0A420HFW3_9PEZI|nr:hypothetical protein OnM2_082029 [Erysiphe neolycopersici]